jgi:hypothetical protein
MFAMAMLTIRCPVTGDERPTPIDFGDWSFNERSHDSIGTTRASCGQVLEFPCQWVGSVVEFSVSVLDGRDGPGRRVWSVVLGRRCDVPCDTPKPKGAARVG